MKSGNNVRGLLLLIPFALTAQEPVTVTIDLSKPLGALKPIWAYFGYDEPNYTYLGNGPTLVHKLGELHKPVYFRTHSLLTTGDGKPALKWGSTNAYTEDANGNPIYRWAIVDRIFDTYKYAGQGAKPFVEIGFMRKLSPPSPSLTSTIGRGRRLAPVGRSLRRTTKNGVSLSTNGWRIA